MTKARILARTGRLPEPSTPPVDAPPAPELELDEGEALPAMPRDAELELNAGELEETEPARKRKPKGKR